MFTLQKMCPITAVDFNYFSENEQLKIYIGDEMGFIRVQDATDLIKSMKPLDLVTGNTKRNPYWKIEMAKVWTDFEISETISSVSATKEKFNKPLFEEKHFKQECTWKAHRDAIKYIKLITESDINLLFSAGLDKMARLWTTEGKPQGSLKQGKTKKKDRPWNFPLKDYDELHGNWLSKVEEMLASIKTKWEEDKTLRQISSDDNKKQKLDNWGEEDGDMEEGH